MRMVALAVLLALPAVAAAERLTPAAREKLEEGIRLHDAGDFAGAVSAFRDGYALQAHRDFLYAIGQSERKRGNCRAAIEAYRAFLETRPPAGEARRAQANLERCQEKEKAGSEPPPVEEPPSATPTATPAPEPIPSPASKSQRPRANDDGLMAPTRPVPARPQPDRPGIDWVSTTLYASGGAFVALGGTLLLMANGRAGQANAAPTVEEFQDGRAATARLRYMGGASLVIGAALATGGVIRTVMHRRGRAVGAAVARGGGILVWGGEF